MRTIERVTGGITIAWHGDPARGCAEVGLCDVNGSLLLTGGGESESTSSSSGPDDDNLAFNLDLDFEDPVVRVLRGPPGDPAGSCVDQVGDTRFFVASVRRGTAVRLTARLSDQGGGVAGRCAGPLTADLADVAFTTEVQRRLLRSGTATLDFSGQRAFAGGPFSGEVVSTLRVVRESRVGRDASDEPLFGDLGESSPEVSRGARVGVDLRYRIVGARGTLTTVFAGLPSPLCLPLDACGLSGTQELAVRRPRGVLTVFSLVRRSAVRGGGRAALVRALRSSIGRRGSQLTSSSASGLPGSVAGTAAREGGATCRDRRDVDLPELGAGLREGGMTVTIGDRFSGTPPAFRTRCAGPVAEDLGGGVLARATIPWSKVGARRLELRLRGVGAAAGPFAITRTGELTLELRLDHFGRVRLG